MTTLTKIFVGLLVFLSLLLAAASVTFLSTVPDYGRQLTETRLAEEAANARANAAENSGASRVQASEARLREVSAQLDQAQTQLQQLQTQLAETEAEVAATNAQLAEAQSTAQQATQAVLAVQSFNETLTGQVAGLRDENNQYVQQFAEASRELAQTQNELAYAEIVVQRLSSQQSDLQSRNDVLERALADAGINPGDENLGSRFAPRINGVIVQADRINEQPYASISVGREDDVRPGMQFYVIDRQTGGFVAVLNVEQVNDAQAFGRLEGTNVGAVDSGDEVSTQIRSS